MKLHTHQILAAISICSSSMEYSTSGGLTGLTMACADWVWDGLASTFNAPLPPVLVGELWDWREFAAAVEYGTEIANQCPNEVAAPPNLNRDLCRYIELWVAWSMMPQEVTLEHCVKGIFL